MKSTESRDRAERKMESKHQSEQKIEGTRAAAAVSMSTRETLKWLYRNSRYARLSRNILAEAPLTPVTTLGFGLRHVVAFTHEISSRPCNTQCS
jgi:hypothetical protein